MEMFLPCSYLGQQYDKGVRTDSSREDTGVLASYISIRTKMITHDNLDKIFAFTFVMERQLNSP